MPNRIPPRDEEPRLKQLLELLKVWLEVLRLIGEIFA